MPTHDTAAVTCMIWPLLDPGLSQELWVERCPTNCTSWVTVNFSPLTVRVETVWPTTIDVNFVGSDAVPRTFSSASVASWAATTRLRVFPDTMMPLPKRAAAPTSAITSTVIATTTSMMVKPSEARTRVLLMSPSTSGLPPAD